MKKSFLMLVVFLVFIFGVLTPQKVYGLCSGTGCRGLDPSTSGCSASAYTVAGWADVSGTNGTVRNELRYSTSCVSNWSRATVRANNSNTIWLYAKVWEKPNPGWYYYQYIGAIPLSVGSSVYTKMVSGTVTTVSFSGISSTSWSGPYNPSHQYQG